MTQKHRIFEMIGVLSLSLMLTTAHAVSGALPLLMEEFPDVSVFLADFLISVPALFMTLLIALNPLLSRFLSERALVLSGLILIGVFGCLPFFLSSFPAILLTRVFLGIGIGLLNAPAVSMIGVRFSGHLREKLQGIRMSAEMLGQTILTMLAGVLLTFGWKYSFLIYSAAFLILVLYLAFVPQTTRGSSALSGPAAKNPRRNASAPAHNFSAHEACAAPADKFSAHEAYAAPADKFSADKISEEVSARKPDGQARLSARERSFAICYAVFAGFLISSDVLVSLRLPIRVVSSGMGSAVTATTILSISIFAGFLGGVSFGRLLPVLRHRLLPLFLCLRAAGLVILSLTGNLYLFVAGAILAKFSIICCTSYVFNTLSDRIAPDRLATANAITLVGCNLGSSLAPAILGAISFFWGAYQAPFFVYAAVLLVISSLLTLSRSFQR